MEMIADAGRLGSLDVMELNPAFDVRQDRQVVDARRRGLRRRRPR